MTTETSLDAPTTDNTTQGGEPNAATKTDAQAPADDAANKAADTQTGDDGTKAGEDGKADDAAKTDDAAKGKDAKDAKTDDKSKDEPKIKAPEKYDIKVAEGIKITPEVLTTIEAYARANDLSQESAQALIDMAPQVSKMFASQLVETAKTASANWAEQTRSDKELSNGGDKPTLDANLALAAKARDAFASKELLALLGDFDPVKNANGTGLGNHPEIVRLFARLGKSISEDNKLVTGGASKTEKTAGEKLYGNTKTK